MLRLERLGWVRLVSLKILSDQKILGVALLYVIQKFFVDSRSVQFMFVK